MPFLGKFLLKVDQKNFAWVWSKCGQSGYRTLKLTISQEYSDGVSRFFNAGTNSGKLKFASMIFEDFPIIVPSL